jgi:Membrane protein involved in the export of O-antigen and teichoic acid
MSQDAKPQREGGGHHSLVSQLRELTRHSFIYGVGGLVSRFLAVLLLPLYTHYLSPADYGAIATLDRRLGRGDRAVAGRSRLRLHSLLVRLGRSRLPEAAAPDDLLVPDVMATLGLLFCVASRARSRAG